MPTFFMSSCIYEVSFPLRATITGWGFSFLMWSYRIYLVICKPSGYPSPSPMSINISLYSYLLLSSLSLQVSIASWPVCTKWQNGKMLFPSTSILPMICYVANCTNCSSSTNRIVGSPPCMIYYCKSKLVIFKLLVFFDSSSMWKLHSYACVKME